MDRFEVVLVNEDRSAFDQNTHLTGLVCEI